MLALLKFSDGAILKILVTTLLTKAKPKLKSKIKFSPDMVSTRKMTEILVQFYLAFQCFSYFIMALSF